MADVWDENWYGSTKTLDVTIGRLRQKLESVGVTERVVAVRGVGFRLEGGRAMRERLTLAFVVLAIAAAPRGRRVRAYALRDLLREQERRTPQQQVGADRRRSSTSGRAGQPIDAEFLERVVDNDAGSSTSPDAASRSW